MCVLWLARSANALLRMCVLLKTNEIKSYRKKERSTERNTERRTKREMKREGKKREQRETKLNKHETQLNKPKQK